MSLVPLRDLLSESTGQVVGNLLLLAALGFLAPLRFAALASIPRILVLAASCSVTIETAQYVLQLDRVSSVDDVRLNTAGAGLAAEDPAARSVRLCLAGARGSSLRDAGPLTVVLREAQDKRRSRGLSLNETKAR